MKQQYQVYVFEKLVMSTDNLNRAIEVKKKIIKIKNICSKDIIIKDLLTNEVVK